MAIRRHPAGSRKGGQFRPDPQADPPAGIASLPLRPGSGNSGEVVNSIISYGPGGPGQCTWVNGSGGWACPRCGRDYNEKEKDYGCAAVSLDWTAEDEWSENADVLSKTSIDRLRNRHIEEMAIAHNLAQEADWVETPRISNPDPVAQAIIGADSLIPHIAAEWNAEILGMNAWVGYWSDPDGSGSYEWQAAGRRGMAHTLAGAQQAAARRVHVLGEIGAEAEQAARDLTEAVQAGESWRIRAAANHAWEREDKAREYGQQADLDTARAIRAASWCALALQSPNDFAGDGRLLAAQARGVALASDLLAAAALRIDDPADSPLCDLDIALQRARVSAGAQITGTIQASHAAEGRGAAPRLSWAERKRRRKAARERAEEMMGKWDTVQNSFASPALSTEQRGALAGYRRRVDEALADASAPF